MISRSYLAETGTRRPTDQGWRIWQWIDGRNPRYELWLKVMGEVDMVGLFQLYAFHFPSSFYLPT